MATYQQIAISSFFSMDDMEYFCKVYKGIVSHSIHEGILIINGMIGNDLRSQIINEMNYFFDVIKVYHVITEDDDVTYFESSSSYMSGDSNPFA